VAALRRRKYAPAYVARLVKYGKQFFHAARRAGLLPTSPFDGLKVGAMTNPDRMYFLTREDTDKIIDACPDAEWRLIIALARYGGLRCPSELVALTWADVDWARGRFLVKAPKTAHHADGGRRWVPLFPEIRPYLEAVYHDAEPGTLYVVKRVRSHDTNLRTMFDRIVYKAGLIPWPKPFQNMRASRETELAQTFPLHVVTNWIGNSARVAAAHYLQVTDADFDRAANGNVINPIGRAPSGAQAAQKAAQSGAERECPEGTVVPAGDRLFRENVGTPKNAEELRLERYARQDSNL
jgi:integrase